MTNEQLAAKIFELAGGAENILSVTNCMTRVRLQLAEKIPADEVKKLEGVLGTNYSENEFQIIVGPGKSSNVAAAVKEILSKAGKPKIGDGKALHEEIRAKNATPFKLFLKKIASIFVPLIPGFIACGLITGIIGVTLKISPELADAQIIKLLSVFGNAVLQCWKSFWRFTDNRRSISGDNHSPCTCWSKFFWRKFIARTWRRNFSSTCSGIGRVA